MQAAAGAGLDFGSKLIRKAGRRSLIRKCPPPPTRQRSRGRVPLGALKPLLPYALVYRSRIVAALIALIVASAATLVVPLAVRRMVDFGFSDSNAGFIRVYFLGMIGVVAVLALASGARYYLVMTLGERVVADLRSDLFAHLTRLDPGFFDAEKTGEIASRLSADTTQLKATFGSSASLALRNLFLFVGAVAMMVGDQPQALGLRARGDSRHRAAAVRRRPGGPPAFAPRPGHARRGDRVRDREPLGGARHAVVRRRGLHRRPLPQGGLRRL